MTTAQTKAHTELVTPAEKRDAVRDFLRLSLPPSYTFTKRARDLTWTEARDIVFSLHGLKFTLDDSVFHQDSVVHKFTAKRDSDGKVIVTPKPKPPAHPDKRDALFGVNPDKICGVQFEYIRFSDKGETVTKGRHGHIPSLDPRFLVMLTWLCEQLNVNWGVTTVYHLGFLGNAKHLPDNAHHWGRAVDFAGVGGDAGSGRYDFTILEHWGKQPITMPVDWGHIDPKTKKRKYQQGQQYPQWPDDFRDTTYRLAPNIVGVRNRHDNTLDQAVTLPAFIFRDAYHVAATEGKDTNNSHDPPTKIGKESQYIIHPDHHDLKQRTDHKDHIHMQVGPTNGGFLAS